MVGEGCILKECTVKRSVIGIRSRIETGCVIDNALLMGADYYESPLERMKALEMRQSSFGSRREYDDPTSDSRQKRAHRPQRAHRQ